MAVAQCRPQPVEENMTHSCKEHQSLLMPDQMRSKSTHKNASHGTPVNLIRRIKQPHSGPQVLLDFREVDDYKSQLFQHILFCCPNCLFQASTSSEVHDANTTITFCCLVVQKPLGEDPAPWLWCHHTGQSGG